MQSQTRETLNPRLSEKNRSLEKPCRDFTHSRAGIIIARLSRCWFSGGGMEGGEQVQVGKGVEEIRTCHGIGNNLQLVQRSMKRTKGRKSNSASRLYLGGRWWGWRQLATRLLGQLLNDGPHVVQVVVGLLQPLDTRLSPPPRANRPRAPRQCKQTVVFTVV